MTQLTIIFFSIVAFFQALLWRSQGRFEAKKAKADDDMLWVGLQMTGLPPAGKEKQLV